MNAYHPLAQRMPVLLKRFLALGEDPHNTADGAIALLETYDSLPHDAKRELYNTFCLARYGVSPR